MKFTTSEKYWIKRYKKLKKRPSGDGSYGENAIFKSDCVNESITRYGIKTILDFGCGDGNQASMFHGYGLYVGVDIAPKAIELCREKYKGRKHCIFAHASKMDKFVNLKIDLVLSMDVIFHLVEDEVYHKYMQTIFDVNAKYIGVYSTNTAFAHRSVAHVKHRNYSKEFNQNSRYLLLRVIPHIGTNPQKFFALYERK